MPSQRIRVIIHDGDPISRAGLHSQFRNQSDIAVLDYPRVAACGIDGDVAVSVIDVIDAPATRRLQKLVTAMNDRVLLVTNRLNEPQIQSVLETGVHSILWRHEATTDRLVKAIRAAARNGIGSPAGLSHPLTEKLHNFPKGKPAPDAGVSELTPREVRVLRLISQGTETKEIARHLCYSERTIKGIMHDVMVRLQLKNRSHAVAFAIRAGYI